MHNTKFVQKYCGDMSDDFVYLAACQSGMDSELSDAFLGKGASAVVANSETIYTEYNLRMENAIVTNMLKVNPSTSNYYTLEEAMTASKASFGANDSIWARSQASSGSKSEIAEPLIFGGGDARDYRFASRETGGLVGKVSQAADRSEPVAGASVSVYASDRLVKELSSDEHGNYRVSLPVGDYRIEVRKGGFVPFVAYASISDGRDE